MLLVVFAILLAAGWAVCYRTPLAIGVFVLVAGPSCVAFLPFFLSEQWVVVDDDHVSIPVRVGPLRLRFTSVRVPYDQISDVTGGSPSTWGFVEIGLWNDREYAIWADALPTQTVVDSVASTIRERVAETRQRLADERERRALPPPDR